jgi:hypothetical protein
MIANSLLGLPIQCGPPRVRDQVHFATETVGHGWRTADKMRRLFAQLEEVLLNR